jgi:hypothetical protein
MTTDFSNQVNILGEFYINYREDSDLKDFLEFNDIGLPLSYLASEGLCDISEDGKKYVAESWEMFLLAMGITDEGFENLGEIFLKSGK